MRNRMFLTFCILQLFLYSSHSTTHWFVSDGVILPQIDSIFQLRKPYDLLALLQQEERAKLVEQLRKELIEQKNKIDQNEDKEKNLEEKIYRTYPDCISAGKPLTEFDLYASASIDLGTAEYFDLDEVKDFSIAELDEELKEPFCYYSHKLDFSMFMLDHLPSMQSRANLTASSEDEHFELFGETDSSVWGHWVALAIKKNDSSWVLYTLASQYWKIRGEIEEAIKCIRIALYFSSRNYRYIPLFYLGNIFHRSHQSEDAVIVLHMALDHNGRSSAIHEMLGGVYATIGYYNESVMCFDNALHIKTEDDNLVRIRHAVLCHAYLETALEKQLNSLEGTLSELRSYQKKHDEWLSLQQKLLIEQATPEMKLESRLEYEEQKIRESPDGRGQDCFQYQQDGHTFLSCNMRRDQLETQGSSSELMLDLQSLLKAVEAEAARIGQQVLKRKPSLDSNSPPFVTSLSSLSQKELRYSHDATDIEAISFAPKDCDGSSSLPPKDSISTVFLPSENKGLSVKDILEQIQLVFQENMSPTCSPPSKFIEGVDSLDSVRAKGGLSPTQPDIQGSSALTSYGFHLYDTETEVKLNSAMRQNSPNRWIFLNLAGLYWRIYGNLANSLDCIRQAIIEAPEQYLDVPLVNLASLLHRAGHLEDALTVAFRALQINSEEKETHFLLGNIHQVQGNLSGALNHYRQVLTLSSRHAEARQYFIAISCHLHFSMDASSEDDMSCARSSPDDGSVNGEGSCSTGSSVYSGKKDIDGDTSNSDTQKYANGEVDSTNVNSRPLASFIEDDPLPENLLKAQEGIEPPPIQTLSELSCEGSQSTLADIKTFAPTWLGLSAMNVEVKDHLAILPKEGAALEEPICPESLSASLYSLDHLAGVKFRHKLPHYPEQGLRETFRSLADDSPAPSIDLLATRIAHSLQKEPNSWVIASAAALYWRVMGNASRTVDCLRLALQEAPNDMKAVPLVSLANIFHKSDLLNDALIVANLALDISPHLVLIHFTMANIYTTKGDFQRALSLYQSTLSIQSNFEPARDRMRIIRCSELKESI